MLQHVEDLLFLPSDRKLEIGCSKRESGRGGGWLWVAYSTSGQVPSLSLDLIIVLRFLAPLLFQTPAVVNAAFDLLVSLGPGCLGSLG